MEKRTRSTLLAIFIAFTLLTVQSCVAYAAKPKTYTPFDPNIGGINSAAGDVNDNGQVVGSWYDSINARHAYVWSLETGRTDLAELPGQTSSFAICINNIGEIAGYCVLPDANPPYRDRAVIWTSENTIIELDSGVSGQVRDINENGEVVGFTEKVFGGHLVPDNAFMWNAVTGITEIPVILVGTETGSVATGINDKGKVVGYTIEDNAMGKVARAFSWTAEEGTKFLVGPIGAVKTVANDINNKGEIAGSYAHADRIQHAIVWMQKGEIVPIGTLLEGSGSVPFAINNKGQVVGVCSIPGAPYYPPDYERGFLWDAKKGITELPPLEDETSSVGRGISNNGEIVGTSNNYVLKDPLPPDPEIKYDMTMTAVVWRK